MKKKGNMGQETRASQHAEKEHPFYGFEVVRRQQQTYIQHLLKKYQNEPVTDELKGKIWDELQMEKYLGHVTIPFKIVMWRDAMQKFPNYIEIILDTKV